MDDQEDAFKQGEIISNIDADEDVTLKDVAAVEKTAKIEDDELEQAELKEVVEVVTTAKLMTKVVIVTATITTATTPINAATVTAAPSAARRRKRVTKEKGILVEEPKPLKKQAQIEQDEAYKLDEEVEELKKHLQIVPNDEDDVYTESTPLARKDQDCWLKTYCCQYKLMMLDDDVDIKLRLLEQSAAVS
nr:hypothetical protein [Tanacetum cinerariifolium]